MSTDIPEGQQEQITPPSAPSGEPTQEEKTMGMLAHLLGIFTGFIGALVIWLIKKDQSKYVAEQALEALNFQITVAIAWAAAFVLSFIAIGAILMPIIGIGNLVFCIMGTIQANQGVQYKYPFALRLIK